MYNEEEVDRLISNIIDGDEESFEKLISMHMHLILFCIHKYEKDTTNTEDILQEIIFKLFRYIKSYDKTKGNFPFYLGRIAESETINYCKKNFGKKLDVMQELTLATRGSIQNEYDFFYLYSIDLNSDYFKKLLNKKEHKYLCLKYIDKLKIEDIVKLDNNLNRTQILRIIKSGEAKLVNYAKRIENRIKEMRTK